MTKRFVGRASSCVNAPRRIEVLGQTDRVADKTGKNGPIVATQRGLGENKRESRETETAK